MALRTFLDTNDKIELQEQMDVMASINANALVGRASGGAVRCEVSPIEHELEVNVQQENRIPYPYENTDSVKNGITITRDGRSVSFEGEATTGFSFALGKLSLEVGRYTIGGFSLHSSEKTSVRVRITKVGTSGFVFDEDVTNLGSHEMSFDIAEAISEARLTVQFTYSGATYSGSMTPYLVKGEPISDISSVKLLRYGKNLCDIYGFSADGIQTKDYIRRISNSFGTTISTTDPADSVTVTQTNYNGNDNSDYDYQNGYFCVGVNQRIDEGTQVTVSFDVLIAEKLGNPTHMAILTNGKFAASFDTPDVGVKTRVVLTITWGTHEQRQYFEIRNSGCSGIFSNFQIELGEVATDYEPVNVTEHTPNEDGTVKGVLSVYPVTTLMTDTDGVTIDATYNKDANKVVASLEERIAALETAIVSQ